MSQFILFIRGGSEPSASLSPEEIQASIKRFSDWARKLREEGKLIGAEKLKDDTGLLLSTRDGQIVVDGPFAETKETIGGYFIIEAANLAEAIEITKDCPALNGSGSVELREVEA
ncbi:MAG: hypothetical protein JNK32_11140 [Anaerolineales bacterium]|nr:hypothetical protein [Anaerolineales bacterium]